MQILGMVEYLRFRVYCVFGCSLFSSDLSLPSSGMLEFPGEGVNLRKSAVFCENLRFGLHDFSGGGVEYVHAIEK